MADCPRPGIRAEWLRGVAAWILCIAAWWCSGVSVIPGDEVRSACKGLVPGRRGSVCAGISGGARWAPDPRPELPLGCAELAALDPWLQLTLNPVPVSLAAKVVRTSPFSRHSLKQLNE